MSFCLYTESTLSKTLSMDPHPHLIAHKTEERPWGTFERFTLNEPSTVKIITVLPGEAFSLQRHENRDEYWKIISGTGTITLDTSSSPLEVGKYYEVPRGTLHRIQADSDPVVFLEIAIGMFNEEDIERLEDKYNRPTRAHTPQQS